MRRTVMEKIKMKKTYSAAFLPVIVILFFSNSAVGSSGWEKYYTDNDGNTYSFKKEKAKKDKGHFVVQVREKQVYSQKDIREQIRLRAVTGKSTEGWNKLSHIEVVSQIDCRKKREKPSFFTVYDTDGRVLLTDPFDNPKWEYIVPRSIHDMLRKKVCK